MNNLSVEHMPSILGVFAHPDDETYCAGSTLAKYIACGAEVMVVSATRGEAGQIRSPHVAMRRTLGAVREQELPQACKRLGVQRVVCLYHQDGTLENVDREELTGQVVEHIRSFRPDVVAAENVTCLVFSPGAPTAFLGRGEDARLSGFTGANRQGEGQTMGATTCIDVGRYLPQKIATIAAHRTQYALEAEMLPLPILQELMGREYFVRIHPAPEIETELLPASAAATQLPHS